MAATQSRIRTISKKQLRTYFNCSSYKLNKHYITESVRAKMGLSDRETYRLVQIFNIKQTDILVRELQLSGEELVELSKL